MKKAMTILYEVHDNLYVNLTNRCSCACTFCLRQTRDHMEESDSLWLEREPSVEEVKAEFAKFVKETWHKPTRINTNGQSDLINGKKTAPLMQGLIDTLSISLNTPNADRYHELVRSQFGDQAFQAMLDFAKDGAQYVPHVVMTTVDTTLTKDEEKQCQEICDRLGVKYRIRPWED